MLVSVELDSTFFAEGLALVDSTLVQLTWKEGVALLYDLETLEPRGRHVFSGEGWGICYDGEFIYMSNGTSRLTRRDPGSFGVLSEIPVVQQGAPVQQLNELECVGDVIYANVYMSDRIVQIDKHSGTVVGVLDGFGLGVRGGRPNEPGAVLNGIAYIQETAALLVTGKLWARVLALRIEDS